QMILKVFVVIFVSLVSLLLTELRMMFRLMNRTTGGIAHMLTCVDKHIRAQGLHDMIVNVDTITAVCHVLDSFVSLLQQDPEKYVEQLLSMFNRFSDLVRDAFYDDPRFLTTRDKV